MFYAISQAAIGCVLTKAVWISGLFSGRATCQGAGMRSTLIAPAVGLATVCWISSSAHAQPGSSFACGYPHDPLGELVCRDPDISHAHLWYVREYQAVRRQLDRGAQDKLRQEADTFNQKMRSECGIGAPDSGKTASPTAIPCVRQHFLAQRDLLAARLPAPAADEVARLMGAPTASPPAAVPPTTAQRPGDQALASQVVNPPTLSPQMAALQRQLEKARQNIRDGDLALEAVQNKLDRAQQAQRDAKANVDEVDQELSRKAGAAWRYAQAGASAENAKRELPPPQAAAANATTRVQAPEQRQRDYQSQSAGSSHVQPDSTLQKAGGAMHDIVQIQQKYAQRMQSAQTEIDKLRLGLQEHDQILKAITNHGVTSENYNRVIQEAEADPGVQQRLIAAAQSVPAPLPSQAQQSESRLDPVSPQPLDGWDTLKFGMTPRQACASMNKAGLKCNIKIPTPAECIAAARSARRYGPAPMCEKPTEMLWPLPTGESADRRVKIGSTVWDVVISFADMPENTGKPDAANLDVGRLDRIALVQDAESKLGTDSGCERYLGPLERQYGTFWRDPARLLVRRAVKKFANGARIVVSYPSPDLGGGHGCLGEVSITYWAPNIEKPPPTPPVATARRF